MDRLDYMYQKVMEVIKNNSPDGTLSYPDFFMQMSFTRFDKKECRRILAELEIKKQIKTGVYGIEVIK